MGSSAGLPGLVVVDEQRILLVPQRVLGMSPMDVELPHQLSSKLPMWFELTFQKGKLRLREGK